LSRFTGASSTRHAAPAACSCSRRASSPSTSRNPAAELAICGVEKTDETGRLCRLNLAVHGLEGDIRHGGNVNSYYDDPHAATGQFDFVLANPPFNVNAVDKERLKERVGPGRRFPFGLPRTDNANYLWIQLFFSALNASSGRGRAGFVMANSASDARASEQELRQQLIDSRAVDVMVAVGPNLFYTVTLPCTLWFLDKGKAGTPRGDRCSSSTPATSTARSTARTGSGRRRRSAFWPTWCASTGARRSTSPGRRRSRSEAARSLSADPHSEFPIPQYDVPGLCKAATLAEIRSAGLVAQPRAATWAWRRARR
jgi:type I restriction enzyme M protein